MSIADAFLDFKSFQISLKIRIDGQKQYLAIESTYKLQSIAKLSVFSHIFSEKLKFRRQYTNCMSY